jgi:hypothetical protein
MKLSPAWLRGHNATWRAAGYFTAKGERYTSEVVVLTTVSEGSATAGVVAAAVTDPSPH